METKSVTELEKALEAEPENLDLRGELAAALRGDGRTLEAAEMFRTVVEMYRRRGQIDSALEACRDLLRTEPEHEVGTRLLGELMAVEHQRRRPGRETDPGVGPGVEARDTDEMAAVFPPLEELTEPVESEEDVGAAGRLDLPVFAHGTGTAPVEEEPEAADPLRVGGAFAESFSSTLAAIAREPGCGGLSLFPNLPDAALAEMAKTMTLEQYPKGELILREGEEGDACYVIVTGTVRVLKREPMAAGGDLIEVCRLQDGDLFGEIAILADRRRHATVQALEPTTLYRIPRSLILRLAEQYPDVVPHLERYYRERLLETLLATAAFFQPLDQRSRGRVLARFEPRRFESSERIVKEGEPAAGFFLIVLGSVEITKKLDDGREVLMATLGEGAYFGELSLLRSDVARATVRSAGPVELAMLPPKRFYRLVADHPVLWNELRRVAHLRETEMYEIVTGLTSTD